MVDEICAGHGAIGTEGECICGGKADKERSIDKGIGVDELRKALELGIERCVKHRAPGKGAADPSRLYEVTFRRGAYHSHLL